MLINLSNVPFDEWEKLQAETALNEFESVRDVEFPTVEEGIDDNNIKLLVEQCINDNLEYFNNADRNNAVYIFGDEFFTFYFVKSMLERGIRCIAPLHELSNQSKHSKNSFKKFREFKLHY